MFTPQQIEQISFSRATFGGYDMQEVTLVFTYGEGETGKLVVGENGHKKFCGEDMIEIELEDYVDHLKYKAYVPYKENIDITANGPYENQSFHYGSNSQSSLEDDTYTVRIY